MSPGPDLAALPNVPERILTYENVSRRQVSVNEVHLGQVLHPVRDAAHHPHQLHHLKSKEKIEA